MNTIEEAISDIRKGKFVIVVDDENRENEGDLIIAAEHITPETVNFMMKEARGLICLSSTHKRLRELNIEPMVRRSTDKKGTAFTVSIDAKEGTTTGISAHDRAKTIKQFTEPDAKPGDFTRPGHIFPLRARDGGVLTRAGHTEASVDLMRLSDLTPVGVICEITNEDGTMARLPQLEEFAKKHSLKIISIKDLIGYRLKHDKTYIGENKEPLVEKVAEAGLPTIYGNFRIIAFRSNVDGEDHIALVKGNVVGKRDVLVRVHSECFTGDTLGSLRCDCGGQLHKALKRIEKEGLGVVLYLKQEGRGIGLGEKIKAYALQDRGMDTVEANKALGYEDDLREYGTGAQILRDLGLTTIRLMTNNPRKIVGLEGYGLKVTKRVPIHVPTSKYDKAYMEAKRKKLGHL